MPRYVDGSTQRLAQLAGDYDPEVGSLLVHLTDPIGSVCIIANPIGNAEHLLSYVVKRPMATLMGLESKTAWWVPNIACLKLMCRRAGFSRVELKTRNLPLPRKRSYVRHAVVHAWPWRVLTGPPAPRSRRTDRTSPAASPAALTPRTLDG